MKQIMQNLSTHCKHATRVITITALAVALLQTNAYADWLQDKFNSILTTNAGVYQTQQGPYFVAGGYTKKVDYSTDNLVSIAMPSIEVGCGGIDIFLGSVNFLEFDKLVAKAENILKNTPYIAFSLGLKTLSTQFGDTIEAVQSIIDQLNQLQLDDCAAAQGLVTTILDGGSAVKTQIDKLTTITKKQSSNSSADYSSSGESVEDNPTVEKAVQMQNDIETGKIPDLVARTIVSTNNYMLEVLKTYNYLDANETEVARAIFGDIFTEAPASAVDTVRQVEGCAKNITFQELYQNKVPFQTTSVCGESYDTESILTIAQKAVEEMVSKLTDIDKRKETMTTSTQEFIEQIDFPIYSSIKYLAMINKSYAYAASTQYINIAASSYAYVMIKDLSNTIASAIKAARQHIDTVDNYGMEHLRQIKAYEDNMNRIVSTMHSEYRTIVAQLGNTSGIITSIKDMQERASQTKSKSIVMNNK